MPIDGMKRSGWRFERLLRELVAADHADRDAILVHLAERDADRVFAAVEVLRHALEDVLDREVEALFALGVFGLLADEVVVLEVGGEADHGVDDADIVGHAHGVCAPGHVVGTLLCDQAGWWVGERPAVVVHHLALASAAVKPGDVVDERGGIGETLGVGPVAAEEEVVGADEVLEQR